MKHLSAIPEPPSRKRPRGAARPRHDRAARAREEPAQPLPVGRGDGRRPRPRRAAGSRVSRRDRDRRDDGALGRRHRGGGADDDLAPDDAAAAAAARPPGAAGRLLRLRGAAAAPPLVGRGCSRSCCSSPPAFGAWFAYNKIQDQLNANKPVAVPSVVGIQQNLAVAKVKNAGFTAHVVKEPSETVKNGHRLEPGSASGQPAAEGERRHDHGLERGPADHGPERQGQVVRGRVRGARRREPEVERRRRSTRRSTPAPSPRRTRRPGRRCRRRRSCT